jgi:RTX calcium-binding nonapeptide repeat (4 copies)
LENLILQGNADLQGYGNGGSNALFGNSGSNILNGEGGADVMVGGAGNDIYFVDNFADAVFENPGEGIDTVFSTAHFRLSENVETLVLQGNADLQGYGDSHANTLYGNTGNNILNGEAGADMLVGGQGNDAFIFDVGQAAGDTVVLRWQWRGRRGLIDLRRLRPQRNLHQRRPDPLAGELQWWCLARGHHFHERRIDPRERYRVHVIAPSRKAKPIMTTAATSRQRAINRPMRVKWHHGSIIKDYRRTRHTKRGADLVLGAR